MGCDGDLKPSRVLAAAALLLCAVLLVAGGCGGSPAPTAGRLPTSSPTPTLSPTSSSALTPQQFVSAYLLERARLVLPDEPLARLRPFVFAGVPWLPREELVATGKLLAEKALGHTLTSVDCQVTVTHVTPASPAHALWARVQADAATALHWTDSDGHVGSDTATLAHTVTVVVDKTKSGRWRVLSDQYADPEVPHLLMLAGAGPKMVQAARQVCESGARPCGRSPRLP